MRVHIFEGTGGLYGFTPQANGQISPPRMGRGGRSSQSRCFLTIPPTELA
jgi:hypothetical protein